MAIGLGRRGGPAPEKRAGVGARSGAGQVWRQINQSNTVTPDDAARPPDASTVMSRPTDDVKNWMNIFRWIVKLVRDDYKVDEK